MLMNHSGGWATHLKQNMRKSNWILSPAVKIKDIWNHHLPPRSFVVNLSSEKKNYIKESEANQQKHN